MLADSNKKYFGIRRKLILVISVFMLIVITTITAIELNVYTKYAKNVTRTAFFDQTQQMNNTIDIFVSNITKQTISLSVNPAIKSFMDGIDNDLNGFRTVNSVTKTINSYQYDSPYMNVYLYNTSRKMLMSTDKKSNITNYENNEIAEQEWYKTVITAKTDLVLITDFVPYDSDNMPTFSIAFKYTDNPSETLKGIIVFSLSEDFVQTILKDTSFVSDGYVDLVIANKHNEIIYVSNKESDFDTTQLATVDFANSYSDINSEYTICENVSDYTGWSVYGICKNERLYQQLNETNMMIGTVTIVGFLVLMLIIVYICNKFTTPIIRLSNLMKQSEESRYSLRAEIKSNDEITELSRCFNLMLDSVVENQILRKNAEIYALQQQINPHFLYNTLGAIKTLTRLERKSDVMLTVDSLSNMFRYSVNLGQNKYVRLEEELNHVKNYLNIMNIRFDYAFQSKISVDENCYHYLVPCFILQPLVENSFTHGIHDMLSRAVITVRVTEHENHLTIEVCDNGHGIEENELESLLNRIDKQPVDNDTELRYGLALANVHHRIKLVNESLEGLKITSVKGEGFKVTINLPKTTKVE